VTPPPSTTSTQSIEARLHLAYEGFRLDVNLEPAHGWTTILGPSGCGKTTLLECLAGLRTPQEGYIRLGDLVAYDSARALCLPPRLRGIGYVSQHGDLFGHLDVRGNLLFGQGRSSSSDTPCAGLTLQHVAEQLELTGLLDQSPKVLSGGERQRVALGRALLSSPRVLLLDEPLSAVDSHLRGRLLSALLRIKRDYGLPCLYVTHNQQEAVTLADELIVMDRGRIIERDNPFALSGSPPRMHPLRSLGANVENLLEAIVGSSCPDDGTTALHITDELCLTLPWQADLTTGLRLRVSVRAEDIVLARGTPEVSARNQIQGEIVELVEAEQSVYVRVLCAQRSVSLWSRITLSGLHSLELTLASSVLLLIKSQAIEVHAHA
jgi:molybdate transport system ATP-binding protein